MLPTKLLIFRVKIYQWYMRGDTRFEAEYEKCRVADRREKSKNKPDRQINQICDKQFRQKCFESTLECIKQVRGFFIAHFGPAEDENFLETKANKLSARNGQLRLDPEICMHLLKSRGGPRVSENLTVGLSKYGIVYQTYGKNVIDFAELMKFVASEESVKNTIIE